VGLPLRAAALLLLAAAPLAAQAELWGYVDGAGVAHVAPMQVDARYRLLLGESAARRVPGKSDTAASLVTWLGFAPEVKVLQPALREAAALHHIDIELLKAIIAVESAFDAKAVSPRGAVGLMQILPSSAELTAEQLLDPRTNILAGARMMADLIRRFDGIDVALAAWNAGEGTVRRHGGQMPPLPETRALVHQVLELYWALLQGRPPAPETRLRVQPILSEASR
jgi:soluble lytic murein transglycosylase-like protein